jgi:MFS transporter, DHA2 family, multidrug resistance protein
MTESALFPSGRPAETSVRVDPLGLQELENLRQQQASALAYFDCFWMFAVLTFVLVLVALLMKRSVAEKGARTAPSE